MDFKDHNKDERLKIIRDYSKNPYIKGIDGYAILAMIVLFVVAAALYYR